MNSAYSYNFLSRRHFYVLFTCSTCYLKTRISRAFSCIIRCLKTRIFILCSYQNCCSSWLFLWQLEKKTCISQIWWHFTFDLTFIARLDIICQFVLKSCDLKWQRLAHLHDAVNFKTKAFRIKPCYKCLMTSLIILAVSCYGAVASLLSMLTVCLFSPYSKTTA